MTSDPKTPGDEEMIADAQWAWVADVYGEVPTIRPDATTRVVRAASMAASARQRAKSWLRWTAGMAAGIAALVAIRYTIATRHAAERMANAGPPFHGTSDSPPATSAPAVPTHQPSGEPARGAPTRPGNVSPPPINPALPRDSLATAGRPELATADSTDIPGLTSVDRKRLRAGLGDRGIRELAPIIRNAASEGLPLAPLLDRAMAGVAHDAPPSVVRASVERRILWLKAARGALNTPATDNEIVAGADALEAGVKPSQLADVQRLFPQGQAVAGLLTLAGLVGDGVPVPAATSALAHSVDAGASDAMLLALRNGVTEDVARGVPPLAALRTRVERLTEMTPRSPLEPPRPPSPDLSSPAR